MVWQTSITDILNTWAQMGVFSYVIPFLLIFAVVFAILQKTEILGNNKAIMAIISVAVSLIALMNDYVSTFFAELFPKFGVGLAVFLVLIILLGFFFHDKEKNLQWIGWVVGIGVVIWAIANWNSWRDKYSLGLWLEEYFWPLAILGGVIAVIIIVSKSGGSKDKKSEKS